MRGFPGTYVMCICGSDKGFPKSGRCRSCASKTPKRYAYTDEIDEQLRNIYRSAANKAGLSSSLKALADFLDYPKHIVLQRAATLGLARHSQRPWKPEEIARLVEGAGQISTRRLAQELCRSYPAVSLKLRELKVTSMPQGHYSESEIAKCFGATWTRVKSWISEGMLRANEDGRIDRGEVLRFIVECPEAFDPRTVDLVWFRDILKRIGVMVADLRERADGDLLATVGR